LAVRSSPAASYHNAQSQPLEADLFETLARAESPAPAFAERTLAFTHVFRDRSAAAASKIDLVGDAELRRFIENIWPKGFYPTDPLSPDKAKQAAKVRARLARVADPQERENATYSDSVRRDCRQSTLR
jgi:hypothetical protein